MLSSPFVFNQRPTNHEISPIIVVLLAVILSVVSAGLMVVLNYDAYLSLNLKLKLNLQA